MTDETYGIDAALGVGQPYAEYEVTPGWGYKVFTYDEDDLLVDEYTSQPGNFSEDVLRKCAIEMARAILDEEGYTDAQIHEVDS